MQKLKMKVTNSITFKEGCERYLEYCRQRNLREETISRALQNQQINFLQTIEKIKIYDIIIKNEYLHYRQGNSGENPVQPPLP